MVGPAIRVSTKTIATAMIRNITYLLYHNSAIQKIPPLK